MSSVKKPPTPKVGSSSVPSLELTEKRQAAILPILNEAFERRTEDVEGHSVRLAHAIRTPNAASGIASSLGSLLPLQSAQAAKTWTYRIAGNVYRLATDRLVGLQWEGQLFPEKVLTQIVQLESRKNREGAPGASVTMQFLTGLPAGKKTVAWWSSRKCAYVARQLGAGRPSRGEEMDPFQFQHITDLVLFAMVVEIGVGPRNEPMVLGDLVASQSNRRHNRTVLQLRHRALGPCPDGHLNSFPCWKCPRGYDTCNAAVRPKAIGLPVVPA